MSALLNRLSFRKKSVTGSTTTTTTTSNSADNNNNKPSSSSSNNNNNNNNSGAPPLAPKKMEKQDSANRITAQEDSNIDNNTGGLRHVKSRRISVGQIGKSGFCLFH